MFIQKITAQLDRDFSAIMQCEHCGRTHRLTTGYNDGYYHNQVIPAMTCKHCGKNRSGEVPAKPNTNGLLSV